MWKQEHWSARWLRPLGEAQAETLGHRLGDAETRIRVKTLAFKLQVVAVAGGDTLSYTPADTEAITLQDTQGGV